MSSTSTTASTTNTAGSRGRDIAASSTGAHQSGTIVAGEQAQSVSVASQLASSTVDGQVTSKSNLGTIVGDLGAAHTAHAGWLEAETQKITQWGQGEIARLMSQTKGIEERLVADAQTKQKALDEKHKAELARMVQQLDAKKAMELKELEDGLQRQIQSALNTTKADINNIESEMNKRKMALMQQAQAQTAKDVSRLTNLSVEAKLIPSTTRTVIETNTNAGTVVAVAGGGEIKTGGVESTTIGSEKIQAAPMAGTVTQKSDVVLGDIRRDSDNAKVGDGVIVATDTAVKQHTNQQPIHGALPGPVQAGGEPVNTGVRIHEDPTEIRGAASSTVGHSQNIPLVDQRAPVDHKTIDAAYGRPVGDKTLAGSKTLDGAGHRDQLGSDPAYNKHADTTEGHHHKEGLLSKIKHAVTGEPKSTDSHNRL